MWAKVLLSTVLLAAPVAAETIQFRLADRMGRCVPEDSDFHLLYDSGEPLTRPVEVCIAEGQVVELLRSRELRVHHTSAQEVGSMLVQLRRPDAYRSADSRLLSAPKTR